MKRRIKDLGIGCLLCVFLNGCVSPSGDEPEYRPPVGIVRSVNLAERYIVFEAEFRIPPGKEMHLLREGILVGRVRAGAYRRRKFQSADILAGRPQPGDLVEPMLPVQPQPTEET